MSSKNVVFISDNPMTLGIQFLISHLKDDPRQEEFLCEGILASGINANSSLLSFSESEVWGLISFLHSRTPLLIGLSTIERSRTRFNCILKKIKDVLPHTILVAGGVDASSDPELYLSAGFDFVVRGDGELAIASILHILLDQGNKAAVEKANIPGVVRLSHYQTSVPAVPIRNMPMPYYGEDLYILTSQGEIVSTDYLIQSEHLQFQNKKFSFDMYTNKGCTHKCSFCAQDLLNVYEMTPWRSNIRQDPDLICEYLTILKERFPRHNYVYFWDLDFLRRPTTEIERFTVKYRETVGLPFFIFVTEKTVIAKGEKWVGELVDAGLETINMGLQSGSRHTLQNIYQRGNTPEEALKAIQIIHSATRNHKVNVLYDVITYNSHENIEDLMDTINLLLSIPPSEKNCVKLFTHKLSFNAGQPLAELVGDRTLHRDYQGMQDGIEDLEKLKEPYLNWLIGHLLRGEVRKDTVGLLRRENIGKMLTSNSISHWNKNINNLIPLAAAIQPMCSD